MRNMGMLSLRPTAIANGHVLMEAFHITARKDKYSRRNEKETEKETFFLANFDIASSHISVPFLFRLQSRRV